MKSTTLSVIRACIEAGQPVLLVGEPGTAKTAMLQGLSVAMGRVLETVIASTRDPADFGGYVVPHGADGKPELLAIGWARRVRSHVEAGRKVTVFFDEINCAPPAVQAPMLRVINERWVGDLYLGDRSEVAFVAAANPVEHAAGGWDLAASMANRLVHLTWAVDFDTWASYLAVHGAGSIEIRSSVLAFNRSYPGKLLAVPDSEAAASRAWPSPRSWEALCRVVSALSQNATEDEVALAAAGCVGPGVAREWLVYRQSLDLQDPEDLLANPEMFGPPDRGDKLYATLTAIAAAVANRTSVPRWNAAWRCYERVGAEHRALVALAARMLAQVQTGRWASLPATSPLLREMLPMLRLATGATGGQ